MKHLLIVDENSAMRNTTRDILGAEFPELSIAEATCGSEAVCEFEQRVPDLVIIDIGLREENGLQLTRTIKRECPDARIVVFTSYDMPEYRRQAGLSGAEFFLSKVETKARELIRVVSDLLSS